MKLYIIRHGQTDWNVVRRLQGRTDIPLNENGVAVAQAVGRGMKARGIRFDAVISSPLSRAKQTAQIVLDELGCSVPVAEDQRITEISFGIYEGYSATGNPDYPLPDPDWHYFMDAPQLYRAPEQAESFETLIERTAAFLEDLRIKAGESDAEKSLLISTHGCASRALLYNMQLPTISLVNFWQGRVPKNCAVSIACSDGGPWQLRERDVIYYEDC